MKKGFTLIELLVVVAIIGMLSSVVLSALNQARASARDARRGQDMAQVVNALELYYNEWGMYPPNTADGGCGPGGVSLYCMWNLENDLVPTYMPAIPADPIYSSKTSGYYYLYYTSTQQHYSLLRFSERLGDWCEPNTPAENNGWDEAVCP